MAFETIGKKLENVHSIKSESQFRKVIYQQVKKKYWKIFAFFIINVFQWMKSILITKKYAHKMSHTPANSLHISCPPVHLSKIEKRCWKL